MLYVKETSTGKSTPVVDMLMEETERYNTNRAKLNMMNMERKFDSHYQDLKERIEDSEARINNYKRILAMHQETVGNNGDTYITKVAGI